MKEKESSDVKWKGAFVVVVVVVFVVVFVVCLVWFASPFLLCVVGSG